MQEGAGHPDFKEAAAVCKCSPLPIMRIPGSVNTDFKQTVENEILISY